MILFAVGCMMIGGACKGCVDNHLRMLRYQPYLRFK